MSGTGRSIKSNDHTFSFNGAIRILHFPAEPLKGNRNSQQHFSFRQTCIDSTRTWAQVTTLTPFCSKIFVFCNYFQMYGNISSYYLLQPLKWLKHITIIINRVGNHYTGTLHAVLDLDPILIFFQIPHLLIDFILDHSYYVGSK